MDWNDVLHFSPVHPAKVRDLAIANNLVWHECQWFEIDPLRAGFTQDNSLIFLFTEPDYPDYTFPPREFVPLDPARLQQFTEIPESTRRYFSSCSGADYVLFVGIPHILHRGAIDVTHVNCVRV